MIQKALLGGLTPEEEEEHQRIEQHQRAKTKGVAICLPLNTILVEAHQELAKRIRTTKDMATTYKNVGG